MEWTEKVARLIVDLFMKVLERRKAVLEKRIEMTRSTKPFDGYALAALEARVSEIGLFQRYLNEQMTQDAFVQDGT